MSSQLPLNVGLKEESEFETFVPGSQIAQAATERLFSELSHGTSDFYCFFGAEASGKTHLLQAACRMKTEQAWQSNQRASSSLYLPLRDLSLKELPDMFNGLEQIALVTIDDVGELFNTGKQKEAFEDDLADLILKSKSLGHTVLLSSEISTDQWPVVSKSLLEALVNVINIPLAPLTEKPHLVDALQKRSRKQGFHLPIDVANYLIKQFSPDLQELLAVLQLLEQASFVEKRKLTLPFVKKVLAGSAA